MQDLTWAAFGYEEMRPFDIAPKVEQQKSQGNKEQAQFSRPGSSTGPHGVHQAIAGLNAEAATILVSYLAWSHAHLANDDVSKAVQSPASVTTLAVDANDMNGESLRVIRDALAGVGRVVAFASYQQGPGSTRLATDDQGDDGREGLLFQVGDDPVVVEAAIQVEAFETQAQGLTATQQTLEHIQRFVRLAHQGDSQRVALVLLDDIQGGKAVEMGGAAYRSPPAYHLLIFLMLSMIRDFGDVDSPWQTRSQQLLGQLLYQQSIHARFQFGQLTDIGHQSLTTERTILHRGHHPASGWPFPRSPVPPRPL